MLLLRCRTHDANGFHDEASSREGDDMGLRIPLQLRLCTHARAPRRRGPHVVLCRMNVTHTFRLVFAQHTTPNTILHIVQTVHCVCVVFVGAGRLFGGRLC